MKRFLFFFFAFLFLFFCPETWADDEEKLVFPLPRGTVRVTNTYGATAGHSGVSSKYALDMQAFGASGERCDTYGAPILAAKSGEVIHTKLFDGYADKSYGTHVILKHPDGSRSWYAHMIDMGELPIKKGDQVKQGQILGFLGDTGTIISITVCPWQGRDNRGAHLHFEMRDKNDLAILAEPMRGESKEEEGQIHDYSGFKVGGAYKSGTTIFDPTGFWLKHASEVPYRFQYDPDLGGPILLGGPTLKESPKIQTIFPLQAKLNELTTFTVSGDNLASELDLKIKGCKEADVTWLKGGDLQKRQFTCTPTTNLIGSIQVPGDENSQELFGFHIDVYVKNNLYSGPPSQIKVEPPDEIWPNTQRTLLVIGKNLPYDLTLNISACENFTYAYRSSTFQKIICHLPKSIANSKGKEIQGAYTFAGSLQSQSLIDQLGQEKAAELLRGVYSFNEDYRLGLVSVSPQNALYGQKTTFTFSGLNIGRAEGIFIERCAEFKILSRTKDEIQLECIPLVDKALFSPLMPNSLKYGEHAFVLKDKAQGTILAQGKLKFIFKDRWVDSVTPLNPILEQENQFVIQGQNLPDRVLVWIPDCEVTEAKKEVFYQSRFLFKCKPKTIGGDKTYQMLQNMSSSSNASLLLRALKQQERLVEIKLPKELTGSQEDAITLYRGTLKPTLKGYETLLEDPLAPSEEEERIQDILAAEGDYSGRFLKSVGWEELNWLQERKMLESFTDEQKENIRKYPNYQLLSCTKKVEDSSLYTLIMRGAQMPVPWLNVMGPCAMGLTKKTLPATHELSPFLIEK